MDIPKTVSSNCIESNLELELLSMNANTNSPHATNARMKDSTSLKWLENVQTVTKMLKIMASTPSAIATVLQLKQLSTIGFDWNFSHFPIVWNSINFKESRNFSMLIEAENLSVCYLIHEFSVYSWKPSAVLLAWISPTLWTILFETIILFYLSTNFCWTQKKTND